MKLYQAGPMRGYDNFNFQQFEDGKAYLKWLGHEVVSPHDIDIADRLVDVVAHWFENERGIWQREFELVQLTPAFSIESAMRRDIAAILDVEAISFLPGWQYSKGSCNEYAVAKMIGIPLFVHRPWAHFHEAEPRTLHVSLSIDALVMA